MLKILIVDDEENIVNGIARIIERLEDDFVVIGKATNGMEAMDLVKENLPDVVITDIKMPKMNGDQLVHILSEKYPNIRKIVISGFSEFNLVRNTFRDGIDDYILKPIDNDYLVDLLREMDEKINFEKLNKQNERFKQKNLYQSNKIAKELFFKNLINTTDNPTENVEERLLQYDLKIEKGTYYVLTITIDNVRFFYGELGAEEVNLYNFMMRNIVEESVNVYAKYFSYSEDIMLVIGILVEEGKERLIDCIAEEILNNLTKFIQKLRFSISIGIPVCNISDLNKSFEAAKVSLRQRLFNTSSSIIRPDSLTADINASKNNEISIKLYDCLNDNLKKSIEAASLLILEDTLNIVSKLVLREKPDISVVLSVFSNVYVNLDNNFIEFRESAKELFMNSYSYSKEIEVFDTFDEIVRFNRGVYTKIIQRISSVRNRKDRRIIEIVKSYIESHFDKEVSLIKISEITFVSSSYISDLFKKQTGETISDYLTRVRINKAKLYLKDINIKLYEVGEKVGYTDPTYFSKVFKKNVGISPKEYRNL